MVGHLVRPVKGRKVPGRVCSQFLMDEGIRITSRVYAWL